MAERLAIRDFGKSGNFVDFTTTTVTNTSGATLFNNGSFSVAFWVKTTQRMAGRTIVGRRAGTTLANRGWLVGPSGSGFLFAEFSDTTNEPGASGFGPKPIADGNWHHVVFVVNRDTDLAYAYVDGVAGGTQLDISALGDIETGATSNFRVGRDGSGNNAFHGKVDELIVWNTVITEAEAMQLYAYGSIPQPDSRRLQWDFNDDALDQSGNGIDGTVSGVTYSTNVPTTIRTLATSRTTATNRVAVRDMGTALSFDGVDDNVNTGKTMTQLGLHLTDFSVSAWYKTPNAAQTENIIATRNISVATNIGFNLIINSGNAQMILCDGSASRIVATSTGGGYADGRWRQLTATVDRDGLMSVYSNGVFVASTSVATQQGSIENTVNVAIGAAIGGGSLVGPSGFVDEPRIWNRVLTATEIQNLYLYGAVPQDGLVAEYLFDEATGTTALDTSGNGNHGTITGATYTTDTPLRPRTSV